MTNNRKTTGISGRVVHGATALACALLVACAAGPQTAEPEPERFFPPPPAVPVYVFEHSVFGSDDLAQQSSGGGFLATLVGVQRGGGQGLTRPLALAARQGRVAVVNALDQAVSVFDFARHQFVRWDLSSDGAQRNLVGVSVDRQGRWYVADAMANVVLVLSDQGQVQRRIGGTRWLSRLVNVAVDPAGQRVYAIDQTGRTHRIRVFDATTGSLLGDVGEDGSEAALLNLPVDAAVGPDGRLYVVDSGNFRVAVFDRDGKYLFDFGSAGKRPGQFARPKEIAIDTHGRVYVADAGHGDVQVFDAQGKFLFTVGTRADQGASATYMLPAGVALDGDERLYVLDQWYVKLDVYRPLRRQTTP